MYRCLPLALALTFAVLPPARGADAFDSYINPILAKAPAAVGAKEIKQLTPEVIADNQRVLPNTTAAFIVVQTNEGRFSKLLVQAARQKVKDEPKSLLPLLLIERFVTYREGQERAIEAQGQNVYLFPGFQFNLDIGQVVPAALGGDLRLVAEGDKVYAEPVGKAKVYLLTKPLPEAAPKKSPKPVIGESFETRYFNGKYKLYDDGRRSGTLLLKVTDEGNVSGAYYSDKDGRKYDVSGKTGPLRHAIQFTIQFPQAQQVYQGWLFTGNGQALTGSSRLQEREAGFYAVRVEEE